MFLKSPQFIVLIIALLNTPYINVGGFANPIILLLIACIIPSKNKDIVLDRFFKQICSIFIFVCIFSILLFLFVQLDFKYLSRGVSTSAKRIIEVYFCYKLLSLYGKKTLYYILYGLFLAYSINIILALFSFGVQGLLISMFSVFTNGFRSTEALGSDEILESSHSILLIMPFVAVYYFCTYIEYRKRISLMMFIIAGLISLLAFKRIAIAAALVIFILYFFKKFYNRFFIVLTGLSVISIGLFFIFLISSNILYFYSNEYEINLMSRDSIWQCLDDVYTWGPDYIGKGWGFTTRYLDDNSEKLLGYFIGGVHNDLLKIYIDLGFWGFLTFFAYFLIYVPLSLYNMKRHDVSFLFLLCQLYLFMIYFTDNAQIYFACQIVSYTLPFIDNRPKNKPQHRLKYCCEINNL